MGTHQEENLHHKRGPASAPPTLRAQSLLRPCLRFTNSSSHWGSPCGPPVWSTPVVGHHAAAPAQLGTRATAGRSPRHTIRSPTRGWVTLRPSSAPQLRHTPEGGATTPTPGVPDQLRPTGEGSPTPGGHHNTRAPQKGPHTRGTPHRHTTKPSHSARGPTRPRHTTTGPRTPQQTPAGTQPQPG